jgi:drug/metabolite transporter (DMT)-like permease
MLTVLLGLGSAIGYVLHDFLMVKVVRAVAVWTAMTWSMGTGMLILVPLALILYGLPSGTAEWHAATWAVAAGLCEAAALACLLRGLVTGNLSIVTPLASLAGGMVAVIAVAGGEPLTVPAMVGLPLAVAGGLLASIERAPAQEVFRLEDDAVAVAAADGAAAAAVPVPAATPAPRRGTAGAGWALLSSVLFAVVILLLDQATALPSVSIAACGRVGTMVVLVPVTLFLGGLRLPRMFRRRCVLAGVGDAVGFMFFAAAIVIGPLAVASVVISQGGTIAVLLGYVVLRERLSRVQYAGVACTIAACTLFAVS